MPEAARGRSVWPRPQAPHSPQPPESTLPDGVLGERDSASNVTVAVTIVTSRLCYRDGHHGIPAVDAVVQLPSVHEPQSAIVTAPLHGALRGMRSAA
jgi:hypothetical protein